MFVCCAACNKWVRVDKPIVGSIHICLLECERTGIHIIRERRRGPFWKRRTEAYCKTCDKRRP